MSDTTNNKEEANQSTYMTNWWYIENPALWFVHLTAVTVQIIFGIGSCIGKEGLKNMPALIFAFYRELFASLILIVICVIPWLFSLIPRFSLVLDLSQNLTLEGYLLLDYACSSTRSFSLSVCPSLQLILLLFGKLLNRLWPLWLPFFWKWK